MHGRHLNISRTRCIEIDWAEDICPVLSTLFTPISCGWAHLCWQRTRWEIVIQSVPLRFNYFYPQCGFCMTSLLHFHIESFMQHRAGGWPPPKSAPCTHQLHIHCSCWLSLDQIWNQTVCICRKKEHLVTFFHRDNKKLYLPHKSVLQLDHTVRNLFSPSPREPALKFPPGMI